MINKFVSKGKVFISFWKQIFSDISTTVMSSPVRQRHERTGVLKQADAYITAMGKFIPKLSPEFRKGECGRIGVVGGCAEYTGAPFFAAMSCMKLGADLVYVICFNEAAPVIKSYSPELIVYPYLDDPQALQKILPCLRRVHALVIGPGLGRDPGAFRNVEAIISYCSTELKTCLPLIIDADGLFLIGQKPSLVKTYSGPVILTPNAIEYSRLCNELSLNPEEPAKVSEALNAVLLRKGISDVICNGINQNRLQLPADCITISCCKPGSVRRCGGQGDILAGCTAVFAAWFMIAVYEECVLRPSGLFNLIDIPQISQTDISHRKNVYSYRYHGFSLACYAACCVTRYCSKITFERLGRSMTASDMLERIHEGFLYYFHE
ncbi:UNVERIFIED_CONTAM: hypothetical protein PYX00_008563 [Menopon gallinae]|uniref:ATP-dependent (S)-NAD(P)H-hydrate dehydratase n=1 Tax=Menopon gallinae TaxID=328185 RepID=A0AAW2HNS7_9NEOP